MSDDSRGPAGGPAPTNRFTDRVRDYERARPGYPRGLLDLLRTHAGLVPGSVVADLGSGTGLFGRMLLDAGHVVHCVEPNDAMRAVAERTLARCPGFSSVDGTAENTGLADSSVDTVTAAQALHWFRPEETHRELRRILRPGGRLVAVWNTRCAATSGFLPGYERLLLRWGTDYREVDHRKTGSRAGLTRFFGHDDFSRAVLPHEQRLDWAGLRARLLSSSYTPASGHPDREPMLRDLRAIFDANQRDGTVRMAYDTEVYYGSVSARSSHAR